ncbi:hypothetical protein ACGFJ7_40400 [Actinoplanes sp. NPDC048988]|uniref:hypothetical protein n=1 Tax=Actinoplanes sp. NPDC048988 TaxID=3363901 RepID=UPI0037221169
MADRRSELTRTEAVAVWAGSATWVAGIAGAVARTLIAEEAEGWVAAAVAGVAAVGFLVVALVVGRAALRREGVERTVAVESSALAFWATVGAALTYSIVDSFADVPALKGPWVLLFGLLAWTVAQATRQERYR